MRRGYTLIELLVVIAVTTMIASIVVIYGTSGRDQIAVSIETAKIADLISRAKARTLATYNDPNRPCGFGVELDYAASKYSLRGYRTSPDCASPTGIASSNLIEEYTLAPGVSFQDGSNKLEQVLFIPPDPLTLLVIGGSFASTTGNIYLSTRDGSVERTVSVNTAGQITF